LRAGVVIVGGGEATRLPGKLALDAGGVPLVVRTYRNVSAARETFISCKGTFPAEVDKLLEAPLVVDRWPRRGPLAGLLTTMACMRSRRVFAVAGDAPFIDEAFLDALEHAWCAGDEAVVPAHGRGKASILQPLAALYDRLAFLREGFAELRDGGASVAAVARRLRARLLRVGNVEPLRSINTRADYERLLRELRPGR